MVTLLQNTVETDNPMNAKFYFYLACILILGATLRFPGIQWQDGVRLSEGVTLHPDEMRVVINAERFTSIKSHKTRSFSPYVPGQTSHVVAVELLIETILKKKPNLVKVARIISLIYGLLTIALLAYMTKTLYASQRLGLLAALTLSFAPLHILESHFGTPDSAATFYFYLVAFLGWCYVKNRSDLVFVLFTASIGVGMAMKFFVSFFIPLGLVLFFEEKKLTRGLSSLFIIAGSFSIVTFFNYTPLDFYRFLRMIAYDNVQITGGHSPLENVGFYSLISISSLGLISSLFLFAGLVPFARRAIPYTWEKVSALGLYRTATEILRQPDAVFYSIIIVHLCLVLSMQIHGSRHVLPFLPLLCLVAASGFQLFLLYASRSKIITVISCLLILAYLTYNALGTEEIFRNDIRKQAAQWLDENLAEGEKVMVFMEYADVRPKYKVSNSEEPCEYILTCDLEYERYFRGDDASKIFHAFGGQERLEFFHSLFAGNSNYQISKEFERTPYTIEQNLIERKWLLPLGTYTPDRYIIFKRTLKNDSGS